MPATPPAGDSLTYGIVFRVPGTHRPITREGLLTYYTDSTGCIYVTNRAGLLVPQRLPLAPPEVAVCRKVIAFWIGLPAKTMALAS